MKRIYEQTNTKITVEFQNFNTELGPFSQINVWGHFLLKSITKEKYLNTSCTYAAFSDQGSCPLHMEDISFPFSRGFLPFEKYHRNKSKKMHVF